MIRLSEAMARMHCSDEVQPKHVKEAFRLLNKSVIRVETPEINFEAEDQPIPHQEEEEEEEVERGVVNGNGNGHMTNGDTPHIENGDSEKPVKPVKPVPTTRKVKITYEQYRTIANLLIMHLRHVEENEEEGVSMFFVYESYSLIVGHPGEQGIRRRDLVNWYLGEIVGDIDSEQELADNKLLTEMVIDRLIQHVSVVITASCSSSSSCLQDRVLLEVKETEDGDSEQQQQTKSTDPNPYLVVHPNYVMES